MTLRYMRYTKEEIDQMGDLSAYRRYFAAVEVLKDLSGVGGGTATPPMGGGPPPTQTRPRRSSSRSAPVSSPDRSVSQDTKDSTYNFPR